MADTANEYSDAWTEDESEQPAQNAVAAAKKKSDATEKDAYITAYSDLDAGQSMNGEDLKDVTPKDKAQMADTIVAADKKD